MPRRFRLLPFLALVLVAALPAPASAAPSCTRGAAKQLARGGDVVVVAITRKPRNQETRRDSVYGCRARTGRRFFLFVSRDFGLDLIERDTFTILDGRHVGVIRTFEGGISESRTARTYDVVTRKRIRATTRCDRRDQGDFSGPYEVMFLRGGGIAYTCNQLWVTDAKGERQLEPEGTDVRQLAVSTDGPFAQRLYWTTYAGPNAETETVRSAVL
jgi:hypothetical protein